MGGAPTDASPSAMAKRRAEYDAAKKAEEEAKTLESNAAKDAVAKEAAADNAQKMTVSPGRLVTAYIVMADI